MRSLVLLTALALAPAVARAQSVPVNTRVGNVSQLQGTAATVAAEAQTITAVADVSGSLASKWWTFHDAGNVHCWSPWYKVSGTGAAPTTTCTTIEVDVLTNDTAATVAGDTRTVLSGNSGITSNVTIGGSSTTVTLTNVLNGASVAAADGVAPTGFGFAVNTAGVSGIPAVAFSPSAAESQTVTTVADSSGSLASTNWTFHDASNAHCWTVWYRVASSGVAPTTNCTAVEVFASTNDTANTIATDTCNTLEGESTAQNYVTISCATNVVTLTNLAAGASIAAADGTPATGFAFHVGTVGVAGTSNLLSGMLGWRLCNNAVQTSTWLAVGYTTDPTFDGIRLAKGQCLDCPTCSLDTLRKATVASQAASNVYDVIQFHQ